MLNIFLKGVYDLFHFGCVEHFDPSRLLPTMTIDTLYNSVKQSYLSPWFISWWESTQTSKSMSTKDAPSWNMLNGETHLHNTSPSTSSLSGLRPSDIADG
jgi:hypothetical protein